MTSKDGIFRRECKYCYNNDKCTFSEAICATQFIPVPAIEPAIEPLETPGKYRINGSTAQWDQGWKLAKQIVLLRDRGTCIFCHTKVQIEVHHLKPKCIGGTDHPRNLLTMCQGCHDGIHLPQITRMKIVRKNTLMAKIKKSEEIKHNDRNWALLLQHKSTISNSKK